MIRILVLGGVACYCAAIANAQTSALSAQRGVLDQYCVSCHNQKLKTAGLQLDKMDLAHVGEQAETWEKVVRKLRAGMMPPQGLPRPAPAAYEALTVALENELDRVSAACACLMSYNSRAPKPGSRKNESDRTVATSASGRVVAEVR